MILEHTEARRNNSFQLPSTNNGSWYRVSDRHIALLRCDRGEIEPCQSVLVTVHSIDCFQAHLQRIFIDVAGPNLLKNIILRFKNPLHLLMSSHVSE